MLFTDFNFLFVFLPLVLTLFWSMRSGLFRLCLLLVSSYFFYGYWNHRFIPLLLLSTTVDYLCGIGIGRSQSQTVRKSCLLLSLCCNLGLLGFFKYYGFFTENLNEVLCRMGGEPVFPVLRIVLPVGISFYTFQSMSYTIDVYRGIVSPTRSFIRFAAYVSLFPQLVAGPIVRYRDLAEQLKNVSGRLRLGLLTSGFQLFLLGMFKKVLIADRLARYVNPMFEQYASIGFLEAWVAVTGYAFQIYFDFSGYSDMALGLGKMLGFRFPVNFNSPYRALNIADFWRRWHISLSTWLRDYLYIPLGGNRVSRLRAAGNVLIVFVLGGLWHGASWTFIVWGAYQGVCIALYNLFRGKWDEMSVAVQRVFTFGIVVVGWVFFRSNDMGMALELLRTMFLLDGWVPYTLSGAITFRLGIWMLTLYGFVLAVPNTNQRECVERVPAVVFALLFLVALMEIRALKLEFLYYQF